MPTGPTLAEVVRRLDDVATRLDRLMDTLEDRFVRRDVLQAMNNATSIQITGIEDEQHVIHKRIDRMQDTSAANRRLIVASFIAPIIVGVVVVILLSALGLHK